MDHLWDCSIVPLPEESPTQETRTADTPTRVQQPENSQSVFHKPKKTAAPASKAPKSVHDEKGAQKPDTSASMITRPRSARIAASKAARPSAMAEESTQEPSEGLSCRTTRSKSAKIAAAAKAAKSKAMGESVLQQQPECVLSTGPETQGTVSATKVLKLPIGKTNLRNFMAAGSASANSSRQPVNDTSNGRFGKKRGFEQSNAPETQPSSSRKRSAPDSKHQSSRPTKKTKARPLFSSEEKKKTLHDIASAEAWLAKEPRPLTDEMSELESWRECLKYMLPVFASGYHTQMKAYIEDIVAAFRYAESLSSRMLDRLIDDQTIHAWSKAILVEVRGRRRAEEH